MPGGSATIPANWCALDLDLRDIASAGQALHALADFTSGMTDRYALRIARMLSGT